MKNLPEAGMLYIHKDTRTRFFSTRAACSGKCVPPGCIPSSWLLPGRYWKKERSLHVSESGGVRSRWENKAASTWDDFPLNGKCWTRVVMSLLISMSLSSTEAWHWIHPPTQKFRPKMIQSFRVCQFGRACGALMTQASTSKQVSYLSSRPWIMQSTFHMKANIALSSVIALCCPVVVSLLRPAEIIWRAWRRWGLIPHATWFHSAVTFWPATCSALFVFIA